MNVSSNYSKKQLKDLRNQFEAYLRKNNSQWSDITVSTMHLMLSLL
jgi:hypothetical protein